MNTAMIKITIIDFFTSLNPFKMVSCSAAVYSKLAEVCDQDDREWSQSNLSFLKIHMAWHQPNVIGERGEPDFYGCRRFLKWFF